MLQRILITVLLILTTFYLFSCDDDIILPKPCTEEPNLQFSYVKLVLKTDVSSQRIVTVNKAGVIHGDNFVIERNGIRKTANIGGYICKDMKFYIDVVYTDSANTSKLKIEGGPIASNLIPGKLLFCSNINNNCNYTQIGSLNGSYSGSSGIGSFLSPLFNGTFEFEYFQQ